MHVVVVEQEPVAAGLDLLPLTYDSRKVLKFLYASDNMVGASRGMNIVSI